MLQPARLILRPVINKNAITGQECDGIGKGLRP